MVMRLHDTGIVGRELMDSKVNSAPVAQQSIVLYQAKLFSGKQGRLIDLVKLSILTSELMPMRGNNGC